VQFIETDIIRTFNDKKMKNTIKKVLRPFIPQIVWDRVKKQWQTPHLVKQNTIKEYQQKYGYTTLVETGTYLGDMVEAQKTRFKKIISIELGVDLFEKAKERFNNDKNVLIVQGDSGKVLPIILKDINEPAIFWLDGHYSGGVTAKGDKECPIFEELDAILNNKRFNHILLIDDARCFIGDGDYPSIKKLTEFIRSKNDKYQVEVKHDIIRYVV
jgi:hypothetical protein